jgi:large subunit ribosomal protein L23
MVKRNPRPPRVKVKVNPPRPISRLELRPHQVLLRPLVTEKGTHQSTRYNAYAFHVAALATKTDIKNAVQELFGVRVVGVRTQMRLGKNRRFRFKEGKESDWKRAVVTLHEEDRIEFI